MFVYVYHPMLHIKHKFSLHANAREAKELWKLIKLFRDRQPRRAWTFSAMIVRNNLEDTRRGADCEEIFFMEK